jgi:hypothetical protein
MQEDLRKRGTPSPDRADSLPAVALQRPSKVTPAISITGDLMTKAW